MRVQLRQSVIPLGSFAAAAVSLALAACGGGSGNSGEQAAQAPATTTSPPASKADPLEGEWRAEFTCQEAVRAIERRLSTKQVQPVTNWKSVLEAWGAEPTKDDRCHGATGTVALLARFAGGNLALLNAETGDAAQARYELVGAHAISVDESEGALCGPCPTRWKYEITGDKVRFHLRPYADAAVYGVWEAAPFERVK